MLSILITHYNRFESISKLINELRMMDFPLPVEIVVSDDASRDADKLSSLPVDQVVKTPVNQGLAHNINKGIKACRGEYILYIQDDFEPLEGFIDALPEMLDLLNRGVLEMIRLSATYRFPYLKPVSANVKRIPRFSLRNFRYNAFRYSDYPYLARRDFYDKYGYYLENTSSTYGENEYMVRIMRAPAKIGITEKYYFRHRAHTVSVRDDSYLHQNDKKGQGKIVWRKYVRAFRFLAECALYNPQKRAMYTFKNRRNV